MENIFFNLGFGWTTSKILPFVITLILGIGLFFLARRLTRQKWMRIFAITLIVIPSFMNMVINPIYEGDFSHSFRVERITSQLLEIEQGRLTVLAIPGCQYCEAAIDDIKLIKSRIGDDQEIDFIVCTNSTDDLILFERKSKGEINIKMAMNINAISNLAGSQFPVFVYSDGMNIRVWSNKGFGVRAKDWIVSKLGSN